jgi:2-(1,2-epoxy-1,2-dihydrophenyl)acetyl-CoA isomerase
MEENELLVEQEDGVAVMTLNRPQALNALTMTLLEKLPREWARLDADPSVRVVVITGAGRGFCSGTDLRQTDMSKPRQLPSLDFSQQWIARLQALSKPTIAAVNGVAAGGGLGLALGCDIRIASDTARFAAIFANIGMSVIDGVGSTLARAVGYAKALELLYTAEIIDAKEAERIGLASYVYPAEEHMAKTLEFARRVASGPPVALAMSKFVVQNSLNKPYVEHLAFQNLGMLINQTFASHDIAEGGRAFREKRKPQFRGPLSGAE